VTLKYDGSPIARHLMFVLRDGSTAIQWDADHVQDIFSGKQRPFQDQDYGHAISDEELDQLKDAGRVSHFDRGYVWVHALPEGERFSRFRIREETAGRIRAYYLNTTLSSQQLDQVVQRLHELDLDKKYTARDEGGLVAIVSQDGRPFDRLADAEAAQNTLRRAAPQLLADAAVAFMESSKLSAPPGDDLDEVPVLDLETLIASQTQRFTNVRKLVVGVDRDPELLRRIEKTLLDMGVEFMAASSAQEALYTIEDLEPDLVLMNLVMPDMHAWQVNSRMRANQALSRIPVIIISEHDSQTDQVFAVSVAKVHDYLVKPISPGQLRQSVWTALKGR